VAKILMGVAAVCASAAGAAQSVEHVNVYKEDGRFAGWPANNGMWSWGDEIVVGFIRGYFKNVTEGHAIDSEKPAGPQFARSIDGGRTWTLETPSFLDEQGGQRAPMPCTEAIDFTHPDFAMRLRMNNTPPGHSRIYYSHDRCRTWAGPYQLPLFDQKRIMARTDYIVNGPHDAMAFVTAAKQNGREGRVFCTRTTDGGQTWRFVSWIGPEPDGFSIMPATVRLSDTTLVTTIRRREGREHWIDVYRSTDDGQTWHLLKERMTSTGGSVGNPPSLTRLPDGRLVVAYGYRSDPYGIRARISRDGGETWGDERVLRDDGGCWDLGYPRTVQRADGKLVTIYYFNDAPDAERYIAATIWDPGP
jgi:photosystem II stability/assembly factor-like uncharacterized protein